VSGVEYAVASGVLVSALLVPIGDPPRSAVDRLTEAVQQEQGGFLFVAGLPSLPRSDALAQGLHGASGHSGSGTSGVGTGVADTDPGYGGPEQGGGNISGTPEDAGGASGESEGGGGEPASGDDGAGDDASLDDQGGGGDEDGATDAGSEAAEDPDSDVSDGTDHGGPQYCSLPAPSAAAVGGVPLQAVGALQISALPATHVGNPIHVLTGNKYQRETDIAGSTKGLAFERHYNSRSQYAGVTGRGWRHSYETTLSDTGAQISIWQADGRRILFDAHEGTQGIRHFRARLRSDGRLKAGPWGYEWRWRDGTVLSFSKDGALVSHRMADGQWIELIRDTARKLVALKTGDGSALSLTYNAAGRLVQVRSSKGSTVGYQYDDHGRLVVARYPDEQERRYAYADPRDAFNLTAIHEVRRGDLQMIGQWRYDDQDRAVASMPPLLDEWVSLQFRQDATDVRKAGAAPSRYQGGRVGGVPVVTAIEGAGCGPCTTEGDLRYRYDRNGQVMAVHHGDGQALRYTYDDLGRLVAVLDANVGNPAPSLLELTYRGQSTQIDRATMPSIRPEAYRTLAFQYDGGGHPVAVTEAGFSPTSEGGFEPTLRHRRLAPTARTAVREATDKEADQWPPVRLRRHATGEIFEIEYDDGEVLKLLQHDDQGRPTRLALGPQPPIDVRYDAAGRIIAAGREGRFRSLPLPAEAGGRALPVSNRTVTTARSGRFEVEDGVGSRTLYGLDDFGRIAFEQSDDAGLMRYHYDMDGRLAAKHGADGRHVELRYDDVGRLQMLDWDVMQTSYAWTSAADHSRPVAVMQPDSRLHLQYDASGRLVERTREMDQRVFRSRYRYDAEGRRAREERPSGLRLHYRYHTAGPDEGALADIEVQSPWRMTKPLVSDITGLSDGQPRERIWDTANGIRTTLSARDGRLHRAVIGDLHDFRYHYDAQGRITGIDNFGHPWSRYRFDARGGLDLASVAGHLYAYRYDANGNRLLRLSDGVSEHYRLPSLGNRMLGLSRLQGWQPPLRFKGSESLGFAARQRIAVHHSAGGAVQQFGRFRFERGPNGQITSIWEGAVLRARYTYDAQARRIRKQQFDVTGKPIDTRFYLYDGDQLISEIRADGSLTVDYVYLGHHPVAMVVNGVRYAVHSNHLGAPIGVTDMAGRQVWQAHYAPFGRARVDEDPDGDGEAFTLHLRLPGQYEDPETGLHYNHYRYYDPDTGRYLSPDPLGLLAGMNRYRYADNDPVNHIDPTGLILFAFDGTGNNIPPEGRSNYSNVVRFRNSYVGAEGELGIRSEAGFESEQRYLYMSGVGTTDSRSGISGGRLDAMTGESMIDRVATMANHFFDHVAWMAVKQVRETDLPIDIVGFSRGAASARVFANLMNAFIEGEERFVLDRSSGRSADFTRGNPKFARDYLLRTCIGVDLRFLGLFDTVPHYSPGQLTGDFSGTSQDDDLHQLALGIPPSLQKVAHAVAAHEFRGDFHGVSIHQNADVVNTPSRTEVGLLGAHSDIGGGYAEGDLPDVALQWMLREARRSGLRLTERPFGDEEWSAVTVPVVHDSVGARVSENVPLVFREGRLFKYLDGSAVPQSDWQGAGMSQELDEFMFDERYRGICGSGRNQRECNGLDNAGAHTLRGLVHPGSGEGYSQWLQKHLDLSVPISHDPLRFREDGTPKHWDEH